MFAVVVVVEPVELEPVERLVGWLLQSEPVLVVVVLTEPVSVSLVAVAKIK